MIGGQCSADVSSLVEKLFDIDMSVGLSACQDFVGGKFIGDWPFVDFDPIAPSFS